MRARSSLRPLQKSIFSIFVDERGARSSLRPCQHAQGDPFGPQILGSAPEAVPPHRVLIQYLMVQVFIAPGASRGLLLTASRFLPETAAGSTSPAASSGRGDLGSGFEILEIF